MAVSNLTSSDRPQTFLSIAATAGDSVLNVDDTSAFPGAGSLQLNSGMTLTYTGTTAKTFTGCIWVGDRNHPIGTLVIGTSSVGAVDSSYPNTKTGYVGAALTAKEVYELVGDLTEPDLTAITDELAEDAVTMESLQEQVDTLNDTLLKLLRWNVVTFEQVPPGLEDQVEIALGAS